MSTKDQNIDVSGGQWDPKLPYNELPPLPPQADLETKAILRQCITSRAALAELKQAAELIPNQAMLINTLPVLEAQSSSAIENIVTTADQLFEHLGAGDPSADPATKEALRYREALMEGFHHIRTGPLSTNLAEQVCSRIKGIEMTVRLPGVALSNTTKGEVVYTPPLGETVIRDLLDNWADFLNRPHDLDPLICMAVSHYQFEAIHPFADGNGRTGRVLNSLYLIHEGLLESPILYLSRYIIENKNEYYDYLLDVTRDGNWEPWVLYILKAVEVTSHWTRRKIATIRTLSDHTAEYLRSRLPKIYTRELVDVLFRQPYCRIGDLVDADIAKRQTASVYLKQLAEIGILDERPVGREKVFVHTKLMQLLTDNDAALEPYSS